MPDQFVPTPVKGQKATGANPPTDDNVGVLAALASNLTPAHSEGSQVLLNTDLSGRLRVVLSDPSEGSALDVDITDRLERILGEVRLDADTRAFTTDLQNQVRDALLAGLESVSLNADTRDDLVTRLSDNLESVDLNAATRDDIVTRLSTALESVDLNPLTRDDIVTRITAAVTDLRDTLTTNLEAISLNADTLAALEQTTPQVRGADVSDSNPLPVNVQTNPGDLVDSGLLTVANVAPGATVTLDSADVSAGVTGYLVELTAASSVRIKVVLRRMGTGARDERVFFIDPTSSSLIYHPVDRDAITAAAGGRFRMSITNMDNLFTADVYGSITHVEF